MKLNINIWDVEISTGKIFGHLNDRVFIQFRRPPDLTVVQDILGLKDEYGWQVEDYRESDDFTKFAANKADFDIHCIGADSADVANEIASYLESIHNLKVRRIQFLQSPEGTQRLYQVVRLKPVAIATDSDIPLA